MTNEEAIKSMRNLDDVISITESEHESVKTAISALEHNSLLIEHISDLQNENIVFFNKLVETENENTKLKADIEQWQSTNLKLVCELTRLECENYQLKVGAKRKWKCVYLDNPEDAVFTLGKIYEVENGSITDDFGNSYYNNESTDDLFIWINKFDKFEEVKEK